MTETASERGLRIVGREAELAALDKFLTSRGSPRAFVLTGGPGIGKTTLWEAAGDLARQRGLRVLLARGSGAETQLSSAALIDLLDGVGREELAGLPAPQLNALEVALFRADPTGTPPDAHAIAVGLFNALRSLANREPLLIAIDDIQWLDPASADALAFAARRLEAEDIAVLLARRPGPVSPLERALEPRGLERLEVGHLSFGATRRVLSERLGLTLPRNILRRVFETTLGNPLFTLEVGRTLAARGTPAIGDDLPLPDEVEDLLGTRVAQLTDSVRRLLFALALQSDLHASQLTAVTDPQAVDEAVEAGVIVLDGDRVRPSHPLLAAAAKKRGRARDRRELHLELARVVVDEELRALHLALATTVPDEALAATLADAAAEASARGAAQQAVILAEYALRLTPAQSQNRSERLLDLAAYLEVAGERQRLTDLLTPALESLSPGEPRVRAYLLLRGGVIVGNDDILRYLERALAEARSDARLRASVLAELSANAAATRIEGLPEAEAWAREALPVARAAGPDEERHVLYALAWARSLRGHSIDDVCDRFRAASDAAFYVAKWPERIAAQRLVWRGELSEARTALTRMLAIADERGEPSSYALQRLHMCELELRAGNLAAAERLLDDWAHSAERELLVWPMYERCRALLAAGRGLPDETRRWAADAIVRAEATGVAWDRLEALRALGVAALLAREPLEAAEKLRTVWEYTEREGVADPGAFPVAPDLVEALAELGELDEALAVTKRLRELAELQKHPWGLASARRCEAVVTLARAYEDNAVASLEQAAEDSMGLGLPFDSARSLLALGRAQRRFRKWGSARDTLRQAATLFDGIGSPGWADEANSERQRVGGRRPQASGKLTPAERRVAELAADGLANKEIARTLVVSVRTVEVHLKHAYAKLGIRSRTQLARRLSERV